MSIENDMHRAEQARMILDHDLVKEAFAELRAAQLEAWERSPVRDTEGREQIWHMVKAMDAFKAFFEVCIESGKIAAHKLEQVKRDRAMKQGAN